MGQRPTTTDQTGPGETTDGGGEGGATKTAAGGPTPADDGVDPLPTAVEGATSPATSGPAEASATDTDANIICNQQEKAGDDGGEAGPTHTGSSITTGSSIATGSSTAGSSTTGGADNTPQPPQVRGGQKAAETQVSKAEGEA